MALNIKTFGVRSLTALVFVLVLAVCILWNYFSFSILFLFVSMAALFEFFALAHNMQARPYRITGYIAAFFIYAIFCRRLFFPSDPEADKLMTALLLMPFIVLTVALFNKRDTPFQNAAYTITGLVYAVLPFAMLHQLVLINQGGTVSYAPQKLIAVILLIWVNDTFAYLGGSLYGRRKMMPRISPGKTWEGTITGVLVSFLCSFVLRDHLLEESGWLWPLLGVLVPLLATCGDLVQSLLKRQAQVKDSGSLLPGHGGVLDRFDSLIFVSPFVVVILMLL